MLEVKETGMGGMKKKIVAFFCFAFFIYSCNRELVTIGGSLVGLFGYMDKVAKSEPGLIIEYNESICSLEYRTNIFAINGKQLSECLKTSEHSLIYIWDLRCRSKVCISPELAENIACSLGLDYFVVSEYYDRDIMMGKFNISKPIFGINCNYYKTNYVKSYVTKFIKDASRGEPDFKHDNGHFLLYKGDSLTHQFRNIDMVIETHNVNKVL